MTLQYSFPRDRNAQKIDINHMKIYLRSNSLRSNERKSFSSYRFIKQTGPQVWEDRKRTQAQWTLTKKTAAQGISQILPRKSCWSELDRVVLKRFKRSLRCWSACLRFCPIVSLALLNRLSSSDPDAKSSGGQNKRKGSKRNNLGRREFPPAVPRDDQYVLVRVESD